MLTKLLKFDEPTLEAIRLMQWSEDGRQGVILQQLDRALYVKVNKALEAMGGSWNRKARAHLFQFDPRPQVDGLLENGSLTVKKDGFFETPENIIHLMFDYAKIRNGMRVLEPSAVLGAIARLIFETYHVSLDVIELDEQRAAFLAENGYNLVGHDFMEFTGQTYDRIIMNPPFEELQDTEHVRHAYECLKDEGILVSIMGEGAFFRSDKKASQFREWLDEVGGESIELPSNSFKESGTGVNTRLVWIRK